MKSSIHTILNHFLAISLLLVLSFCSKTGSDPTPNPTQQPALISPSDAKSVGAALIMPTSTETKTGTPPASSTSTQAPKATATTTQISSTTGSTASLGVNYSNLNGAVGGVYAQVQGAPTYFSIPLSGTAATSGKITIPIGIPANLDNGSFTIIISIYDASGRVSNTVSITITIGTAPPVNTNDDPYKDGDPYAKDYFIEYYENGDFHSLNYTMNPLSFTYTESNLVNNYTVGCQTTKQSVGYISIPCSQFGCSNIFSLQFLREGWDKVPKVGVYAFAQSSGGNVDLKIDGTTNCSLNNGQPQDSYVRLNITEVKVVKDYGAAKSTYQKVYGEDIRGYFTGEFEAILYDVSIQDLAIPGSYRKKIITKGRFKLPMGGPSVQLNGTGTVVKADRLAMLTAGKWYSTDLPLVGCKWYALFKKEGTYDSNVDNPDCLSEYDKHFSVNKNRIWSFNNDQTVLHIGPYTYLGYGTLHDETDPGGDVTITELTESTLVLEGQGSFKHTPP